MLLVTNNGPGAWNKIIITVNRNVGFLSKLLYNRVEGLLVVRNKVLFKEAAVNTI
jgi:hypothetical protein